MTDNTQTTGEVKEKEQKFTLAHSIFLSSLLIAGALILPHARAQKESSVVAVGIVTPVEDDEYIRGNKDASVTIVEYSDFGCHFCGVFHPTMIKLLEQYPDDVRWVYRHLPYRNKPAALASECVGQRFGNEAFWQYTDYLFEHRDSLTESYPQEVAQELFGLSKNDFDSCIKDPKVVSAVEEDMTSARLSGANATPHSVIIDSNDNQVPIRGALPYEELEKLIVTLIK